VTVTTVCSRIVIRHDAHVEPYQRAARDEARRSLPMAAPGRLTVALMAGFVTAAGAATAAADPMPLVSGDLPAGHVRVHDVASTPADGQLPRPADGSLAHWVGQPSSFAGSEVYSRGEFVYTDYLWDAYGASSPADTQRDALLDALARQDPQLHRGQDVLLAFYKQSYGAGPLDYAADIDQVRVAAPDDNIDLLVRTTVMTASQQPAILVLVNSTPGAPERALALPVPFNSGITTRRADLALLVSAHRGIAVNLLTGARHTFPTAANPNGYENAIEASIPSSLVGSPTEQLQIAVAAGSLDPSTGELQSRQTGPALANVAFRTGEPARPFFDKLQAAALEQRTIDPFFADVDVRKLREGANQLATPGPGYYERVMSTDPAISRESQGNGILQPYGLYLPADVNVDRPVASTIYLHGSGSAANLEPTIIPGLMRALGDQRRAVVIAPQGRTGLSMWEGAAIEDVFEAQHDAGRALPLDPTHRTLAGYSMGGFGAFLLAALFPDRFAATWSLEGPVGGFHLFPATIRVPDARPVFPNLRWVPTLIRQGGADFNVDVSNGLDAESALHALGYRSRLLMFPGDNHYTPGVLDRWQPEMQYLATSPVIDPNPPGVTYVRSIPFERAVNDASGGDQTIFPGPDHYMRFDHAYWMSALTPANGSSGVASINARSLAIPATPHRVAAESGSGESGNDPYTWSGDAWIPTGAPAHRSNAFTARLTGARAVTLDAPRMRLDTCRPIAAWVNTDHPLTLRLSGRWSAPIKATLGARGVRTDLRRGALVLRLPAGRDAVRVVSQCAARSKPPRGRRIVHRRGVHRPRFTG
jgi:hypothetical protein